MTKIGYNIEAKTARQQLIVETIKSCAYYESSFSHVVKDLQDKIDELHPNDAIYYDIEHNVKVQGEIVYHSIVYEFNNLGQFKKSEIKKFIYDTYDAVLLEQCFNAT